MAPCAAAVYPQPGKHRPDGNFLEGIALARGRFVFLVSDDDLLLPGAVAALLRLIQAHPDFDGFSLNARTFRRSPDQAGAAWFPLAEDCVLRSGDDVLALMQTSLGFMSILAFNKSRLAGRLESGYYQEKRGTNFLQAFLFLDVLAAGRGVVVLAEPLLAQRADNSPLDNYFRVFVTGINAVLAYARQAGSQSRSFAVSKQKIWWTCVILSAVSEFMGMASSFGRRAQMRSGVCFRCTASGLIFGLSWCR